MNCSAALLKHTLWWNISAGRFVNVGETLLKDNVQGDHGGLAQTLGSGPIKIPAQNREFAQNHHGHLVQGVQKLVAILDHPVYLV